MRRRKVKIFGMEKDANSQQIGMTENDVNAWLDTVEDIEITHVVQTEGSRGLLISIFYIIE